MEHTTPTLAFLHFVNLRSNVGAVVSFDPSRMTTDEAAHKYAIDSDRWRYARHETPQPAPHRYQRLEATDMVSALVEVASLGRGQCS